MKPQDVYPPPHAVAMTVVFATQDEAEEWANSQRRDDLNASSSHEPAVLVRGSQVSIDL